MAAMQGLCANPDYTDASVENIVRWSVDQSEALIAELNKREAEEAE